MSDDRSNGGRIFEADDDGRFVDIPEMDAINENLSNLGKEKASKFNTAEGASELTQSGIDDINKSLGENFPQPTANPDSKGGKPDYSKMYDPATGLPLDKVNQGTPAPGSTVSPEPAEPAAPFELGNPGNSPYDENSDERPETSSGDEAAEDGGEPVSAAANNSPKESGSPEDGSEKSNKPDYSNMFDPATGLPLAPNEQADANSGLKPSGANTDPESEPPQGSSEDPETDGQPRTLGRAQHSPYDNENGSELTPGEIADKEESGGEDEDKKKDKGSKSEDDESDELEKRFGSLYKKAEDDDKAAGHERQDSLYKALRKRKGIGGSGAKKAAIALVITAVGGLIGFGGLFGFLNAFKLENLVQNIDRKTFAKVNSAFDERSDRWFRAYMRTRIAELNGEGNDKNENTYFRAKVDNDSPFADFYRNLRTSNFEHDLYKQSGTVFTTITDKKTGKIKSGIVTLQNKDLFNEEDFKNPAKMAEKLDKLTEGTDFTHETFDSYKDFKKRFGAEARKTTKGKRFWSRRAIRNDITRTTGQRKWVLFPRTREKVENTKNDFKKRLLGVVFPKDSNMYKFLTCVLGLGPCTSTTDIADKNNQSAPSKPELDNTDNTNEVDGEGNLIEETTTNEKGETVGTGQSKKKLPDPAAELADDIGKTLDNAPTEAGEKAAEEVGMGFLKGELAKTILAKFNLVTSIKGTLDWLMRLDANMKGHKLSKVIVVARRAAAVATFTSVVIMNSQQNSGEMSTEHFNEAMLMFDGMERSEGYDKLVGNFGNKNVAFAQATEDEQRKAYCDEDHVPQPNEYHFLCEKDKIGGVNNATRIEDAYKEGPGKVLGPAMGAYRRLVHDSGIGKWFDKVASPIQNTISAIAQPVLKATGADKAMEKAVAAGAAKMIDFAGGIPKVTGDEPAGWIFNQVVQGGVATAEINARLSGGMAQTAESKAYYRQLITERYAVDNETMSWSDKKLSLDNPESLASKTLASVANGVGSSPEVALQRSTKTLASMPMRLFGSLGSLFGSHRASASADDPTSFAEWAGMDPIDIPRQCVENDPLEIFTQDNPQNPLLPNDPRMTNVEAVLGKGKISMDWDTMTNPDKFYDAVYAVVGEDEKTALQIYNCYLFDARVTNSHAGQYGSKSTQVEGYSDAGEEEDESPNYANRTDIVVGDTSNMQCEAGKDVGVADGYKGGKLYKIRLCNIAGGINVNSQISKEAFDLIEASKRDGLDMVSGSGSFRTLQEQINLRIAHGCGGAALYTAKASSCRPPTARPKYSNHQMGLAIDFNCSGVLISKGSKCFNWLSSNAGKYGLINLPSEPWHWSVDGK